MWRFSCLLRSLSMQQSARFGIVCILLFSLLSVTPDHLLEPIIRATAAAAAYCLGFLGRRPEVAGSVLTLGRFRVEIIGECTPLYPMALFSSFLLSVPASLQARLAGFTFSAALFSCINILRIAAVTIVGATHPALFEFIHVYLGQVVMVLLVIGTSFAWQRWAAGLPGRNHPFLFRAVVAASVIFPVFFLADRYYVLVLDRLVAEIFLLAGYRLTFSYQHLVYFQTFNLVLFLAMMLAERRLPSLRHIVWTTAGMAAMVAGHLLFRIGNVMLCGFAWEPALPLTGFLSIVGEYLLPVLCWLVATAPFRRNAPLHPGDAVGGIGS